MFIDLKQPAIAKFKVGDKVYITTVSQTQVYRITEVIIRYNRIYPVTYRFEGSPWGNQEVAEIVLRLA